MDYDPDKPGIPLVQLLNNLGLAREATLNLAGLLIFGQRPQRRRPAFVVKAVSFVGNDPAGDKSLRHGHISTLHLWWARRPLPAARGIVFASLVPDPDDPQCPTTLLTLDN